MSDRKDIFARDILPAPESILRAQDMPIEKMADPRIADLLYQALRLFDQYAEPQAIIRELSSEDFSLVLNGEGNNAIDAPLYDIYMSADSLAMFAVTIGEKISDEISRLFRVSDFALGAMLDTAASEGTDNLANFLESSYKASLQVRSGSNSSLVTMRFSPGYCGWDISGQLKLFEFLKPDKIGIRLNQSFLMQPLKSISGVILAGAPKIFYFEDNLSFCDQCTTHSCRERLKVMQASNL